MLITLATEQDVVYLDQHFPQKAALLSKKLVEQEIIVAKDGSQYFGYISWGYLWHKLPFMYELWIEEPFRRQGIGRQLVSEWERIMQAKGYKLVATSTQANEEGQHFYRALGYKDAGVMLLPNEPSELIMLKQLSL